MPLDPGTSRDALMALVPSMRWVHQIDLGGGHATPGMWGPPSELILRALDTVDFAGKSTLDIGCWDGLWSFEAERRGSDRVHATDLVPHRHHGAMPTLEVAAKLRGSSVRYSPDVSVYDAPKLEDGPFDVVLFCGIYYHLKHPLLALARLRQATKEGGYIVIEGEVTPSAGNVAEFYYKDHYKQDCSNWWVPTPRCLREWVECSFFDVVAEFAPNVGPPTRHAIVARAVRRLDPGYAFPDEELRAFCLNSFEAD